MQENDKPVFIYSTFPAAEAAEGVGAALVDAKLAACVNVIPGMVAIYRWEGERHRDAETVMIIKTRQSMAKVVVEEVRRRHSYTNPALIVLPVEGGSPDFLNWIMNETAPAKPE